MKKAVWGTSRNNVLFCFHLYLASQLIWLWF